MSSSNAKGRPGYSLAPALQARFEDLGGKAARARRLAGDLTDPLLRKSLVEFAVEIEAEMAEIMSESPPR